MRVSFRWAMSAIFALLAPSLAAAAVRAQSNTTAAGQATTIVWHVGDTLATPRDHHATFITIGGDRAFLHVAGGNTYRSVLDDVWRAPIEADGSVGAWAPLAPLPSARAGHSVVVTSDVVIITAGKKADQQNTTETLIARVAPDGALGAWVTGPSLPGPRFHHSMAAFGRFVFVTGGLETNTSVPSVFRAEVRNDGTLGEWVTLLDMPRPRSHHASFVHDGALYLVAGLNGNPAGQNEPLRDVLRAQVRADGSLGQWTTVSTLPNGYGTHSAFVREGYVYLLGGVEDNARFSDAVLRAPIQSDGTLGAWSRVEASLPAARSHVHQTPLHRGRIYSVAGSASRKVNGSVWVGEIR